MYVASDLTESVDSKFKTTTQYFKSILKDAIEKVVQRDFDWREVVMGSALVLAMLITMYLIYKMCTMVTIRPLRSIVYGSTSSRLSIGSLQMAVDEKLRDAPPRYTITPPASNFTPVNHENLGFTHDASVPPPPYTEKTYRG